MVRLRSFGYSGAGVDNVKRVVEAADGVILDIRFMPYSHFRGWTRHGLIELVGAERYRHVKAFGNRNYKGGPVVLDDPAAGVETVRRLLQEWPSRTFFLMCGCVEYQHCHRRQVSELLTYELGEPVEQLTLSDFGVVAGKKKRSGGGGGAGSIPDPPEQETFDL